MVEMPIVRSYIYVFLSPAGNRCLGVDGPGLGGGNLVIDESVQRTSGDNVRGTNKSVFLPQQ